MASIPEHEERGTRSHDRMGRWGDLVVVVVFVALPLAVLQWLVPQSRGLGRAALTHELLVYPSVLVGSLLLYVCWRLARNPTTGWLAAGVTIVGVQGIGLAALRVARPAAIAEHAGWLAGVDFLVQGLLIAITVLAARRTLTLDPLVVGLGVGVALSAVRASLLGLPSFPLEESTLRGLALLVFAGQLVVAALLVRLPRTPLWLRTRIGLAVVLLGVGHLLVTPAPLDAVRNTMAIVCSVLGTAILTHAAFALLRVLVQRHRTTVRDLHERVEYLEADVRVDRARLHEVSATLAGIANASLLLHSQTALSEEQRRALERTVDAEAARLMRLMDRRRVEEPEVCDLDEVLEPLVTVHRARGRSVSWAPSGLKARCRPDDIAEVVNILLENAAQHAQTPSELRVRRSGESVAIEVIDHGPGLPPGTGEELFGWGRRGPGSTGQGIGLSIAHRLVAEQGGRLTLARPEPGQGAVFVATIPGASTHREARTHDRRTES